MPAAPMQTGCGSWEDIRGTVVPWDRSESILLGFKDSKPGQTALQT